MIKKKQKRIILPEPDINIIPMMDIFTTLLFFILLVSTLLNFSTINVTGLPSSVSSNPQNKPMFVLQIVIKNSQNAMVWLGPIKGLKSTDKETVGEYLTSHFTGNPDKGFLSKITAEDGQALIKEIQRKIQPIKQGFSNETSAVVAFTDAIPYQYMIDVIEGVSALDHTEMAFPITDVTGKRILTKVLFPKVIVSEEEGA